MTGSITVVDLINRQRGPVRIPSAEEVDTQHFVGDLLGPLPEEPEPRRGWVARAGKLIGLAAGSMVLCASVVTASALAHERRESAPAALPAAPAQITGGDVLRPDQILAQLTGPTTTAGSTSSTAPAVRTVDTRTAAARSGSDRDDGAPSARPTPDRPRFGAPHGVLSPAQVVQAFYSLVGRQPEQAAGLIDPSLLSDPLSFGRSWSDVRQVRVDSLQTNPDGTVRAVIELLQPDDTWLQVVELLHVSGGSTPVINGAELHSAQRG